MSRFTRPIRREVVFEFDGLEPATYCLLLSEAGVVFWRKFGSRKYCVTWHEVVGFGLRHGLLAGRRVRPEGLPEAGQGLLFPNTPTNGAGDACPERKVSHG